MKTIGIVGSKGKSTTSKIVFSLLKDMGKKACIINTFEDSYGEIEGLSYLDMDYMIVQISKEDIKCGIEKTRFNILIETWIEGEDLNFINNISELCRDISFNECLIVNSDSPQNVIYDDARLNVVTYGLGTSSMVTASSIEDVGGLTFSYCLRSPALDLNRNIIHPFEKPITVRGEYKNIYYYMAAFTCLLMISGEL